MIKPIIDGKGIPLMIGLFILLKFLIEIYSIFSARILL